MSDANEVPATASFFIRLWRGEATGGDWRRPCGRHRRLKSHQERRRRHQRVRVLSGGTVNRLLEMGNPQPPRPAQHHAGHYRLVLDQHRRRHHGVAALSFLGYGLPLGIPEWGGMLSREGRIYIEAAPRLALWPGLCLTVTVYSLNMFGDAVRDLLDPRLRGGGGRLGAGAPHDASVGS